jgi:hypothetical protein
VGVQSHRFHVWDIYTTAVIYEMCPQARPGRPLIHCSLLEELDVQYRVQFYSVGSDTCLAVNKIEETYSGDGDEHWGQLPKARGRNAKVFVHKAPCYCILRAVSRTTGVAAIRIWDLHDHSATKVCRICDHDMKIHVGLKLEPHQPCSHLECLQFSGRDTLVFW